MSSPSSPDNLFFPSALSWSEKIISHICKINKMNQFGSQSPVQHSSNVVSDLPQPIFCKVHRNADRTIKHSSTYCVGGFEAELWQVTGWILEVCWKRCFLIAGVQSWFTNSGCCLEISISLSVCHQVTCCLLVQAFARGIKLHSMNCCYKTFCPIW